METKILEEYHNEREGNDCLIKAHYTLMDVSGIYVVLSLTEYMGWMGYKIDSSMESFIGRTDATEYYNELKRF